MNATKKILDGAQIYLDKYQNKSALDIKSKLKKVSTDTEKLKMKWKRLTVHQSLMELMRI